MTTPTFTRCTESNYDEMLGAVPPALQVAKGFVVGEAWTGKACEAPDCQQRCRNRFDCDAYRVFIQRADGFFRCNHPMTIGEFRALDAATIVIVTTEAA